MSQKIIIKLKIIAGRQTFVTSIRFWFCPFNYIKQISAVNQQSRTNNAQNICPMCKNSHFS